MTCINFIEEDSEREQKKRKQKKRSERKEKIKIRKGEREYFVKDLIRLHYSLWKKPKEF